MSSPTAPPSAPALFIPPTPERGPRSLLPWLAAGGVVLLAILFAVLHERSARVQAPPNTTLPLDHYAENLVYTQIQMSESTSLSGGKSTFIDGHVRNKGSRTVTGATVQVLFAGFDAGTPPQLETVPLMLIRTHEPYVDTEPLSAAPLGPNEDREFRLIFEDISPNWNQQLPEIRTIHAVLR